VSTETSNEIPRAVVDYVASAYEILRISVHCPLMQRRLDNATVTVAGEELGADAGINVVWQLLPKDLQRGLMAAAQHCRNAIAQYAIPFCARRTNGSRENAVPGLYLVPTQHVRPLAALLREGETQMRNTFRSAVPDDATLHRIVRDHVGEAAYSVAAGDIPTAARQLAGMRVEIIAFSIATSSVADENQNETAAAVARQALMGPREALADAINSLVDLIARSGRVSTRSFDTVRTAISRFKMFPDATDPILAAAVVSLEDRLADVVPSQQTAEVAQANGLLQILRQVQEFCVDAPRVEQRLGAICQRRVRVRPQTPRTPESTPELVGAS
jgi:hypothetical protein